MQRRESAAPGRLEARPGGGGGRRRRAGAEQEAGSRGGTRRLEGGGARAYLDERRGLLGLIASRRESAHDVARPRETENKGEGVRVEGEGSLHGACARHGAR